MAINTEISERLCADEAVCFIAGRHNVTPRQLVDGFLASEEAVGGTAGSSLPIALEPNEIEILRGLSVALCDR